MDACVIWAQETAPMLLDFMCAWAEYDFDKWITLTCGT